MFNTIRTHVGPALEAERYAGKVRVIFRPQIQPWHPSSTLTHEAGLAVLRLRPLRFWDFSAAVFAHQADFFDVNVVNEARNQTYARLARLAVHTAGLDLGVDDILALLTVPDRPRESDGALNLGNAVTDDLKRIVRAARVVGVHVSPTVFFNGLEETAISSSFTNDQWDDWLEKNVT